MTVDVARLQQALAFAASCIKSGEAWSDVCEDVIGGALRDSPSTPTPEGTDGGGGGSVESGSTSDQESTTPGTETSSACACGAAESSPTHESITAAVAAERLRCAKMVDQHALLCWLPLTVRKAMSAAIRATPGLVFREAKPGECVERLRLLATPEPAEESKPFCHQCGEPAQLVPYCDECGHIPEDQ